MRIISGTARGKKLAAFSGERIRPTADRVREALFSILHSRLGSFAGLRVLDLFAGTGALALEALSRGTEQAVLVEAHPESLRILQGNITACRMTSRSRVVAGELPQGLGRIGAEAPFQLIFLDPPYGRGLVAATLAALDRLDLLAADGTIVAESAASEPLPEGIGRLRQCDRRVYGATALTFYERNAPPA